MASRKITELTALTAPANDDVLPIIDVSELAANQNKKITIPNLTTQLSAASTSAAGIVQLNDTVASTSTTLAATANAVKTTYDLANAALPKAGGTMTGVITFASTQPRLVQDTAKASTSGTVVEFTGIPSWAKKITVMFNGVSTSSTSAVQVQLGTSGGFEATSYVGGATAAAAASAGFTSFTSGFVLSFGADSAATTRHGAIVISNVSGNIWVCQGTISSADLVRSSTVSYSKSLGGVLTQLRVTTTGADTFDAGSINIIYEG